MKTTELRLGNFIQLDPSIDWCPQRDDLTIIVESIHSEGINGLSYCGGGTIWEGLSKYVGIPLTEEWLLRFGFNKDYNGYGKSYLSEYSINGGSIRYCNGFCYVYSGMGNYGDYGLPVKIDFVHQLQNLYFSLIGQELKINETHPTT